MPTPTFMLRGGKFLLRNGAFAMDPRCCCPGDDPPLPQSCCYDVLGAWDDATGVRFPNVLYGQMSGFGCAALNRPFYMAAFPTGGRPWYRSNYLGGIGALSCVPPQHSWDWRIDVECFGDTWKMRLSDSAPWSNGDFTTLYPVTLISCRPLQLRITNLPDSMFGLTTTGSSGAITLSSEPP